MCAMASSLIECTKKGCARVWPLNLRETKVSTRSQGQADWSEPYQGVGARRQVRGPLRWAETRLFYYFKPISGSICTFFLFTVYKSHGSLRALYMKHLSSLS